MNVYLLSKKKRDYESYVEMAIVTNSEVRAREIANANDLYGGGVWLDSKQVTCTVINLDLEGFFLMYYKYA